MSTKQIATPYTAVVVLWWKTEHQRREVVTGSMLTASNPSDRAMVEHIRKAYKTAGIPVRVKSVVRP